MDWSGTQLDRTDDDHVEPGGRHWGRTTFDVVPGALEDRDQLVLDPAIATSIRTRIHPSIAGRNGLLYRHRNVTRAV